MRWAAYASRVGGAADAWVCDGPIPPLKTRKPMYLYRKDNEVPVRPCAPSLGDEARWRAAAEAAPCS